MATRFIGGTQSLPDPAAARLERDRAIALEILKRGETPTARKEISDEMGVPLSTVYRAGRRELEWARKEMGGCEARPTTSEKAVTRNHRTPKEKAA
jgi:hypothetical protein